MKLSKVLNYKVFTVLFLVFSLIGAVYLSQNNLDNRNKAVGDGGCACKPDNGPTINGVCKNDGTCICPAGTKEGTNKCNEIKPTSTGDKCQAGQTLCQQDAKGKNTGYNCICMTELDPNDWRCTTPDLKACPADGLGPNAGKCDSGNKVSIVGRCLQADAGYKIPVVYKYTCPNKLTDLGGGCQQNEVILRNVSSVCFEDNFCGAQQIDMQDQRSCFISVVDHNCTPTKPPQPTSTPTKVPTRTPTPTKKPTLTPTATPTGTLVPTNTPTITPTNSPSNTPTMTPTGTVSPSPTPTQTPTGTLAPTNTPVHIAQGPSPTRIVLPNSGVEFPIQLLTVGGAIISLFGFLMLL